MQAGEIMTISLSTYLIVCPFVFLAGFVDAIAGGGGIISLPVYLIAGLPVHNALASSVHPSARQPPLTDIGKADISGGSRRFSALSAHSPDPRSVQNAL